MGGIADEIWVYLATDDDGTTGVGYAMTAGSAKIPLIGETERAAEMLRPIVDRLAAMTGKTFTLARFSRRDDVAVIEPRVEHGT